MQSSSRRVSYSVVVAAMLCLVATYLVFGARAFAQPPESSLALIPTPQHVEMSEGVFTLTARTAIALGDDTDADDRFAAEQLIEEAATDLGLHLSIARPEAVEAQQPSILIGRIGRDNTIDQVMGKAPTIPPDQGYLLRVDPQRICVAGRDASGTFYGVQTLRQMIRGNAPERRVRCCLVKDWPALRYRGWQNDISRGPIPTLEYLKREIRTLSEFKLNMLTLYTEAAFRLKKYPIGPADGITAEEVRELSGHAAKYHVELVGNLQSFAHTGFLNSPQYRHLGTFISRGIRKGESCCLDPANEEMYAFLSDVYDEIAPAYASPLFMTNCDEVFYLDGSLRPDGTENTKLKRMIEQKGIGGVYAQHINRLAELLAKHGKTPMIWADPATVITPPQWGTEIEKTAFGGHIREALDKLNKNVILVLWEYEPEQDFAYKIEPLVGRPFMVAPSISTGGVVPATPVATVNISNFVRDGARLGAIGMLNTVWQDNGEGLFGCNWYPLVWSAECAWKPALAGSSEQAGQVFQARHNEFDRAYPAVFYGLQHGEADASALQLLGIQQHPVHSAPRYGISASFFWMDPATSAVQANAPQDVQQAIQVAQREISVLKKARAGARYNADSLDCLLLSARRMLFIGERVTRFRAMQAAEGDAKHIAETNAALAALVQEAEAMKAEYCRLWELENRKSSLDVVVRRYEQLIQRMKEETGTAGRH